MATMAAVAMGGVAEAEEHDSDSEGRIFDGDLHCTTYLLCCCCCCSSLCSRLHVCGHGHRGADECEGHNGIGIGASPSERAPCLPSVQRASAAAGAQAEQSGSHSNGARSVWRQVRRSLRFLDIFRTGAVYNEHLPSVSRTYCLLHYAAAAAMISAVTAVAVHEGIRERLLTVHDGTACEGTTFHDTLRPDLSSSLCSFAINALFTVWFALRAARYEKSGFLVAVGVVVGVQLARAVYFVWFVAPRYVFTDPSDGQSSRGSAGTGATLYHVVDGLITASVLCSLAATAASPHVRRAFGWRSFSQGITQPAVVALRRRYMRLQTCLQVEGVVALNAYLAIVFLADDWRGQVTAGLALVAALTALSALLPWLRCTQQWWPLALCLLLLMGSLISYALVIGANVDAVGSRSRRRWPGDGGSTDGSGENANGGYDHSIPYGTVASKVPTANLRLGGAQGRCYVRQLTGCLANRDIHIITVSSASSGSVFALPPAVARFSRKRNRKLVTTTALYDTPDVSGIMPVNGSSTYLPTRGSTPLEYFELAGCDYTSCYVPRAAEYGRLIKGCCRTYGLCARKDTYRVYGVVLLAVLTFTAFVCLVTLASVTWRRIVAGDDAAIAFFLRTRSQGGAVAAASVATGAGRVSLSAFVTGDWSRGGGPQALLEGSRERSASPPTPPVSRRLHW